MPSMSDAGHIAAGAIEALDNAKLNRVAACHCKDNWYRPRRCLSYLRDQRGVAAPMFLGSTVRASDHRPVSLH
jgi:hypothetical protein